MKRIVNHKMQVFQLEIISSSVSVEHFWLFFTEVGRHIKNFTHRDAFFFQYIT